MELDGLKLPDLHSSSVQVSNLEINQDQFEVELGKHFKDKYVKRYIRSVQSFDEFVKTVDGWAFSVDKNLKLSQSKIKAFWSMVDGGVCPKTFKESLFSREVSCFKESDAMIHGQIFEHMATGQTNYTGDVPDYSKVTLKNGGMTKLGVVIEKNADIWRSFASRYIQPLTGIQLEYSTGNYIVTSLPDVLTEDSIIDLKLGDPDGNFGNFAWSDDKLKVNEYQLLQAKINKFIWFKNVGSDKPFIFYIASKSSTNAKAREIVFDDFDKMIKETEQLISETYKAIKYLIDNDLFKETPEIKFCEFCKVDCSKKTLIPIVKKITVQ